MEVDADYDWATEVKKFNDTKSGVKGLVDAGVTKLPRFFLHPPENLPHPASSPCTLELPVIDLGGVEGSGRRAEMVEEIRKAASTWGFFRLVNHGVPVEVMEAMLAAVKRFHEQPAAEKMAYYSGSRMERVRFTSSVPKRETDAACWRDLLTVVYQDDQLDPQIVPLACREEVQEYVKHMIPLRESMAGLLSEALGLSTDHLSNMECMKSEALACLYYPVCPEPDKTLGQLKHSDASFITLLMQDSVGGLQILHNNQWVDVPPVPGSFIANIGDLMQIISNDKFISAEHRVVAQPSDSRVSVACFFTPSTNAISKPLMPIKELVCDDSPAVYKEFLFMEYIQYALGRGQHVHSALPHFRIR